MAEAENTKSEKRKKGKPIRLSKAWGRGVLPLAGRAAVMLLAAVLLGMLLSGVVSSEASLMRTALTVIVLALILLLFLQEGLRAGTGDAVTSRRVRRMEKEGYTPTEKEEAGCWHPAKAAAALAVVFVIPLALAGYIALTAQPYTYTLQDLPTWLTSNYGAREDIMAPLAAYQETTGMSARIVIRIVVRFMEMVFIGFFADPLRSALTIDRLAPVCILLYPCVFFIGYLVGPKAASKIAARERRSMRAAVRKAEKHSLAEELTRGGGDVHYGQRSNIGREEHKRLI